MLDDDPDRAGIRYTRLQAKLVKYFEYNCKDDPVELANETIDRLAALLEAKPIPSADIERFSLAVAKQIKREWWRFILRRLAALGTRYSPESMDYECFEGAMAKLRESERTLIEEYYPAGIREAEAPPIRKGLAELLGISEAALRQRVNEVRRRIRRYYEECRDEKSP
jgi:hypothetical protein